MRDDSIQRICNRIFTIRQRAVTLDSDLAAIYGVTTRTLNQTVNRNKERFVST
ncbi:MAG: ORF6N domain-containing protein [Opitutales bacterium]